MSFVGLLTGSDKLLCDAAMPFVFNILRAWAGSVVVIVCPLQFTMEDQISKYRATCRGFQAAFVGKAQKDEAVRKRVVKGNYQLVYMSPEAMLLNLK